MECKIMGSDKRELPGIIGGAFKHAGSFVGKTVAIGKKTTRLGVKTAGALKDLLTRPVEGFPELRRISESKPEAPRFPSPE